MTSISAITAMAEPPQDRHHEGQELSVLPSAIPLDAIAPILPIMPIDTEAAAAASSVPITSPASDAEDPNPLPIRSGSRQATLLVALFSALFIASLNTTIIGTATPTITRELHSAAAYAWIGGAFVLGSAVCTPVWAKLSDIWGRKIVVLCAVAGFFASSIVCALAVDISMLLVGRSLQGVSAAGLTGLVSIIISDMFSMRHRSLYIGLMEIIWAIAGGVGPVLGGVLVQHVSWRWVFWIILPPCAVAFVLLMLALDVYNPRTGLRQGLMAVDWAGSLTMLGFLTMLLLGLNFGGVEFPWSSPTVICMLVFGAVLSVVFVFCEKKLARYPLMPLEIFASRSNLAVLFITLAHDFTLFSVEYYLPFYLQSALTKSPSVSGTLVLPFALVTSVSGLLSGIYIHRTGRYRELFWIGQALMIAGFGGFTQFDAETSIAQLCGLQALTASGMGMLFSPPLLAMQASVPQSQTATATSTVMVTREIAIVLALVSGQVIFQNGMKTSHAHLAAAGLSESLLATFSGGEAAASILLIPDIADPAQRMAVQRAYASSLSNVWIMDACLVAVGFLASAFIVKQKLSEEHVETKTGLHQ